jgi:hypothetical protein
MNPNTSDDATTQTPEALTGLEVMTVTDAREHNSGDNVGHHVEVQSNFFEESMIAAVRATQIGDVSIPAEGDSVLVGYRSSGQPVVLGSYYKQTDDLPEYKPGERRIGHPASDAYIRLKQDGTIHVQHQTESEEKAVIKFDEHGGVAMHDHKGYGIECQNNGEVHIYGKVKQHTSQTLDLAE